jgi:putative nucleotidyltransferase with HDIG domain
MTELSLLQRLQQYIASGKLELPVISPLALRIQALAANDDYDMNEVERLIQSDQIVTAEVLRAANSAFYAGLAQIKTARAAVVRLSIQKVARLVFLVSERTRYKAGTPQLQRMMATLWKHANATASAASWLARKLNFRQAEETAFVGGLLHDVGHLVILRALDGIQAEQNIDLETEADFLTEVLAVAHTEIGFEFLKTWNIPDVYCRIARDHHKPECDSSDPALLVIRLANAAASNMGIGLTPEPGLILNSLPEAQILGAGDVLLAELEIMLEDASETV